MKFRFPPEEMHYHFELVNQKDVAQLIELSSKEGILPSINVQYVTLKQEEQIKSIGGFIIKGNTALFKGDYTPKPYRCQGYAKKLLFARMAFVRSRHGVKKIMANCTAMSVKLYISIGFKVVKHYKNGITSVVFSFNS